MNDFLFLFHYKRNFCLRTYLNQKHSKLLWLRTGQLPYCFIQAFRASMHDQDTNPCLVYQLTQVKAPPITCTGATEGRLECSPYSN